MGSLRPPTRSGATLAVPPVSDWPDLLGRNRERLAKTPVRVGGLRLDEFRAVARRDAIDGAREYLEAFDQAAGLSESRTDRPLVLCGHQPELFHPGVWIKNFAARGLADRAGGAALHLITDNDVLARTAIRVPAGTAEAPFLALVPFDRLDGEVPHEERGVLDADVFADFPTRAQDEMRSLPFRPLLRRYWKEVVNDRWRKRRLGERLAAGRRAIEVEFGCANLEVTLSRLCQQPAFGRFAAELIGRSGEFASIHNDSLAAYRAANGIRSRHHPVPALRVDGSWTEAPFWTWTADEPVRRRLFVRCDPNRIALRADDRQVGEARIKPNEIAQLADWLLEDLNGWKIRPRALATTMFLRLGLADLFIHGIGGGKYDELTDAIVRRFFQLDPPAYAIFTATALLPFGIDPVPEDALTQAARHRRDLVWNPDRHIDDVLRDQDPIAGWIERKFELREAAPQSRLDRAKRFRELRGLNERLRRFLGGQTGNSDRQIADLTARRQHDELRQSREYAFCLYPEDGLSQLLQPWLSGS